LPETARGLPCEPARTHLCTTRHLVRRFRRDNRPSGGSRPIESSSLRRQATKQPDYYWYEEPLNDYDLRGYAQLCQALDIPVVVAGSYRTSAQYILQGAGDILRADVYWRGGITGVMKIAHLCEAFGIKAELQDGASPLMDIANLHCACAIRNCDFFEMLVHEDSYRYGLKQYVDIDSNGYVWAPSESGLEVEMDWDYIDNHTTYTG